MKAENMAMILAGLWANNDCAGEGSNNLPDPTWEARVTEKWHESQSYERVKYGHDPRGTLNQ
jgi:hypothetical protein